MGLYEPSFTCMDEVSAATTFGITTVDRLIVPESSARLGRPALWRTSASSGSDDIGSWEA